MMKRLSALITGITTVAALMAAQPLVARVSTLSSGSILLNGKQADLKSIDAEFRKLKAARGEVWYYRENPRSEPHPNAMGACGEAPATDQHVHEARFL